MHEDLIGSDDQRFGHVRADPKSLFPRQGGGYLGGGHVLCAHRLAKGALVHIRRNDLEIQPRIGQNAAPCRAGGGQNQPHAAPSLRFSRSA